MVIKYSKLSTGDSIRFDYVKWAKSRLPVAFLKQQIYLVSLVTASTLLLLITTLFIPSVDYEPVRDSATDSNFGVIVDCGSSGTRAHIFKWKHSPSNQQIELVRDPITGKPLSKHITPGLSSLQNEPDKASEYMEPIMHFVSDSIPQDRHLDTPVYFMATAGLRLLEDNTQKRILSDITQDLRAKFDFPRIKTQVISGEFEGIYSWLSINIKSKFHNASSKSYGMIEMGGASTQVTFELNPEVENAILKDLSDNDAISAFKNEQVTVNLSPSSSVKLFATTFLGLGVNSARQAAIDLLVKDYLNSTGEFNVKKSEIRLKDPCLTMGSSEIERRPTALLQNGHQTIGFVMKQNEETLEIRLEGTGNFLNCMNLLERVLHIVKKERLNCPTVKGPCPMILLGTNFIPYSHYQFIGLSEMFFTTNEMMNSSGLFSRPKVLHETQRICSSQYNDLLEMYTRNGLSPHDRVLYECFKASWLLTILHDFGFKMPVDYDKFQTLDKLDGEEIDWTVGAMIKEVALDRVVTN